ncbi:MAG: undecaprenyl-diphosphate phosphatase [Candidatus Berkiella sp.]
MNELLQVITLAIVQGLTEFLPVSSSAHLILVPLLTGWQDQGLAFDVAVHVGTLTAVCWYFRQELLRLQAGFWRSVQGKPSRFYSKLAWQLIIASFPIALIGFLAHDFIATTLRSPLVIAFATITFGVLLLASDRLSSHAKMMGQLKWKDVAIIGCAQTLALIPGTSRSGITLTAGLGLGYNRKTAAKFSFLLSIPLIVLAGSYEGLKIVRSPDPVAWSYLLTGILFAAVSAYFCIKAFLRLIGTMGVLPFVLYRLALGAFLLFMFW